LFLCYGNIEAAKFKGVIASPVGSMLRETKAVMNSRSPNLPECSPTLPENCVTALPFAHLNLRRNPFGELTRDERTQLAVVEIQQALEHLTLPRSCVQIVGEKGYGKTTHLLAIAGHFPDSSYVHIPEGERGVIPAGGGPLLIDEAQRLTIHQRWHVLRSDRRLILGTHEDFAKPLGRAKRPVLTLAADRLTDAARVFQIVNARIQSVQRSPGPIPSISESTVTQLLTRYGSDLRSIEHSLYHVFQQLGEIRDV